MKLSEGFSFGGTFLYKAQADAEGIAAMLGLQGAFQVDTAEGHFWMPGHNRKELMDQLYLKSWVLPPHAKPPQAHPVLDFKTFIDQHEGD